VPQVHPPDLLEGASADGLAVAQRVTARSVEPCPYPGGPGPGRYRPAGIL